jgi:hypothetical protein
MIKQFAPILIELDDMENGLYLHIDNNNKVVDISYEEKENLTNCSIADFHDDIHVAIEEDDEEKIKLLNDFIKQTNLLIKNPDKKDFCIKKLDLYYETLIKFTNETSLKEGLIKHKEELIKSLDMF